MGHNVQVGRAPRDYTVTTETQLTILGIGEESRDEKFLRLLEQIDDRLVDGILVLAQPTVNVVADLNELHQQFSAMSHRNTIRLLRGF